MKRRLLKKMLSLTGLNAFGWRSLRPGLYIFNYHRIGDPEDTAFDRNVFSCTQRRFREQVALLRERFEIIGLDRLLALRDRAPAPGGRPLALITFDDGYIDNYTLAFPVLKEFGVVATFFIPTAFIGGSRLPWWDEIAWLVRNANVGQIHLGGFEANLKGGPGAIEQAIVRVLRLVKTRSELPIHDQVEEVREACRPRTQVEAAEANLFMDWRQLRELRAAGMDIGSHTHTHEILSHLALQAQRSELADSKAILESGLGGEVTALAYPVGSRSAYSPETCRIAEAVGYRLGFSFTGAIERFPIERPLEISRIAVDGNASRADVKSRVCFGI